MPRMPRKAPGEGSRYPNETRQTQVRLRPEDLDRLAELSHAWGAPGLPLSRSDAIRAAIRAAHESLGSLGKKSGKRA